MQKNFTCHEGQRGGKSRLVGTSSLDYICIINHLLIGFHLIRNICQNIKSLLNCMPDVLMGHRVFRANVLTCQHAWRVYVLMCRHVLRGYVLTYKRVAWLRTHVPTCLTCSCVHVLTCLTCSRAHCYLFFS